MDADFNSLFFKGQAKWILESVTSDLNHQQNIESATRMLQILVTEEGILSYLLKHVQNIPILFNVYQSHTSKEQLLRLMLIMHSSVKKATAYK